MSEWEAFIVQFLLLGAIPFCSYYLGVYIRKTVFPSNDAPTLRDQFLIAIPLSIGVVAPLLVTMGTALSETQGISGYLVTLGVIIEHGLFMNEAVARLFADRERAAVRL